MNPRLSNAPRLLIREHLPKMYLWLKHRRRSHRGSLPPHDPGRWLRIPSCR